MPTASTSVRLRVLPAISTLVAKRASAESGAVAPDHWTEGPHYAEVRELLAAGFAPDAVLLTPGDARQAASWLESLRRAPRLALLPIYRNPLADALGRSGEDSFLMLERLRRRGLLETAGLVERVHTCPSCSAGQLLFVETCPQCGSIDTAEQNFLHCYSCGHVGTQDEYLTNEGLACPKCAVRLRHIGVDYDRALETFACKDCSGRFTEPNVKARCLQCRTTCGT